MVGLSGALVMAHIIGAQLHSVAPLDPATYLFGIGVVLVSMLFACWIPAYRASRINPLESLRAE